jgi:GNAT superfamily N-acetyltransferase
MNDSIQIRMAAEPDVPLILAFIKELAECEKLAHTVVTTEAGLRETLFGARPYAEVLIAEADETPVGFALFFHNYSTFLGQPGIYLEDLYVRPEARGRGVGKQLLSRLAGLARERNCGRLEWCVLNWNTPAIEFYHRQGATPMNDWTTYRVTGQALHDLAGER